MQKLLLLSIALLCFCSSPTDPGNSANDNRNEWGWENPVTCYLAQVSATNQAQIIADKRVVYTIAVGTYYDKHGDGLAYRFTMPDGARFQVKCNSIIYFDTVASEGLFLDN
jgi:hypothetical protein